MLSKRSIGITSFITFLLIIFLSIFVLLKYEKKEILSNGADVYKIATSTESTVWTRTVIGKSVEGRDIESYSYGDSATRLVFVGGIHGGYEWNSVLLAYEVIDYFKSNPLVLSKDISITIIPNANPDGLYKVNKKEGRFTMENISKDKQANGTGRFNANDVDLNRNFDCKWKPKSTWQNKIVNAGDEAFSEPESKTIRDYVLKYKPSAVVFWHSKSNAVYASQCNSGIIPKTLDIMKAYSDATGYAAVKSFDAYETTGAADDWLASIDIPAITVELKTHESTELKQNLAGVKAIINYFQNLEYIKNIKL